jgi:hypothetical protein
LIGGFIVTGTQPKKVIVRAIGPSLTAVGIPGALANPTLELHGPTGLVIASNDDWMDAPNRQEIIDSTLAPTNNFESAILTTLPANNAAYTAIVRGVNDGVGVGLVEAYDLDQTANSKLANISTRGLVQTAANVMIGGFIVVGNTPKRVIVRAVRRCRCRANWLIQFWNCTIATGRCCNRTTTGWTRPIGRRSSTARWRRPTTSSRLS